MEYFNINWSAAFLVKAIMKLACQSRKRMRDLSSLWVPPIYRRLLSADKPERDMAERCLIKVSCIILPPQPLLSKVTERLLLPQLYLIHNLIYLVSNYLSVVCKVIGYMHTGGVLFFSKQNNFLLVCKQPKYLTA